MRISLWSSLCFSSFTPPAAAPRSFLPSIHPSTTTIVSYVVVTDGRFRNQPPPPLPSPFVFGPVRRFVLIILNPAPRASNFRPPRCSCLATTRREEGGRVGKGKKEGWKSVGKFERYSRGGNGENKSLHPSWSLSVHVSPSSSPFFFLPQRFQGSV